MASKRCSICVGSGTVMGGGMMMEDCRNCDGSGKVYEIESKELMNKESEEYKKAKDKIKSLDENMSDGEAEKLLDEELEKQNNVTKLKRRKERY